MTLSTTKVCARLYKAEDELSCISSETETINSHTAHTTLSIHLLYSYTLAMSSNFGYDKEFNPDAGYTAETPADGVIAESTNVDYRREDREAEKSELSGRIPQSKPLLDFSWTYPDPLKVN